MGKIKIVVSDFHIADGQPRGEHNPFEGFLHDEKFAELLHHYSTDYFEDEEVELIINGDFLDLLTTRYEGGFPDHVTAEIARAKVRSCMQGHPILVEALAGFIRRPMKRITYILGNHDFDFVFPEAQEELERAIGSDGERAPIHWVTDTDVYEFDGVEVHHGQQWEAMNSFDLARPFLESKDGEPILNQPWGSLFVLRVLNRFKEKRPYIDRIQPFRLYLFGAIFLDTWFAITLMWSMTREFLRARILEGPRHGAKLKNTLKIILEFSAHPNLERKARKILERPGCHTVIAGHTHLAKVRRFGPEKVYINTGTWTDLISLEISHLGRETNKHYFALVEYPEEEPAAAPEGAEGAPADGADPGSAGTTDEGGATAPPPPRMPRRVRPKVSLQEWLGYRELMREITY